MAKTPDEFLIWGGAFGVACVFLYCMPKIVLVIVIAGLVLGYSTIKEGK